MYRSGWALEMRPGSFWEEFAVLTLVHHRPFLSKAKVLRQACSTEWLTWWVIGCYLSFTLKTLLTRSLSTLVFCVWVKPQQNHLWVRDFEYLAGLAKLPSVLIEDCKESTQSVQTEHMTSAATERLIGQLDIVNLASHLTKSDLNSVIPIQQAHWPDYS